MTKVRINVVAVIVTYHPDLQVLHRLLTAVSPQVASIIIVDNGSKAFSQADLTQTDHRISFFSFGENRGVAAAQNKGVSEARQQGATHVLFLDHDSIPAPDMVEKLVRAEDDLRAKGLKVAAVGPRYRLAQNGQYAYFVRFGRLRFQKILVSEVSATSYIAVDFLIASGSLISVSALADIGGMDDALFIDHVDTDWFLRARHRGYQSFGVCAATMEHALGDRLLEVGWLRKKTLPIHNPLRLFYIFRNSLLLYRRPYAACRWKVNDSIRLCLMFVVFSICVSPRRRNIAMMIRGIADGLKGCGGPYK